MNDEEDIAIDQEDIIEQEPIPAEKEAPDQDIEKEAALMGWQPKEQFRGNPEEWADAETYVKRGREIMPILRKNNERLIAKVMELDKARMEDRRTFEELHKFQQDALERERAATLAALRATRREAIEQADGEAFERAEQQIREVEAYKPPAAPAPAPPLVDPNFAEWHEKNDWYTRDKALTALADSLIDVVASEGFEPRSPEFLEEIGRRVRQSAPAKFTNPNRARPAAVDPPAPRQRKPAGKSYDDLPQEAKELCDRFVNSGAIKGYTREMYVRDYKWS